MPERFRDGAVWEDLAGYSRAARRGHRIEVSGTTANAPGGGALYPGDTYAQAKGALQAALHAVEQLGGTTADVIRTRVYLAPDADWQSAARAHADLLGTVAPANTMLYVARLIGDDFLVEVEIEAELASP